MLYTESLSKEFYARSKYSQIHLFIEISIIHSYIYMGSCKDQGELIFIEHPCQILLLLLYINSFSFHNSMRCYSEDMEKGVNYPKSQVVVVEPVFRQRQSDSRTLRPAVFFVQFYSSGNKVKPFCSFCCSKGKPHICPLTYACIEFFFKLG